jgi:hypothetical protein
VYIDQAYLEGAFGAAQVAALCPTSTDLDTTIELAEGAVESALTMGGYSAAVPSSVYTATSDVPKTIKLAAYGTWLALAHGRHAKAVPEDLRPHVALLDDIREGRLEIPNVPKIVERAVGGVTRTETDSSITDSKPQIFSRSGMEGY